MIIISALLEGGKIPIEERSLKNKPKGVSPVLWLQISKPSEFRGKISNYNSSWGRSKIDGKMYGWSHRAIYGFTVGQKISKDDIGNFKQDSSPWVIKTELEAAQMAANFSNEVS